MKKNIITVSQITSMISGLLREGIGSVSVQGEISNYKHHGSGHRYFSLKDEGSQLSCVMWRSRPVNFELTDGMKVIAGGRITVYPPRGQYQLECTSLMPLGQGDLFIAFEALKKKLEAAGYFAPEIKKAVPVMPLKIGVITSPTGAAVRDIFSTIERRFPAMTVYFRPALVQGAGAAEDIALAIEQLNKTDAELIISGRGGGSLEDLWAFNEEIVADAVFRSEIPVISAVGHETDFTIADFCADIRAATPTAAAEIATPRTLKEIKEFVYGADARMKRALFRYVEKMKDKITRLGHAYAFKRINERIGTIKRQTDEYESRMINRIKQIIASYKQKLMFLEQRRASLYPLSPLRKGFAVVRAEGKIVPVQDSLAHYKKVEIIREMETAEAKIIKVLPKDMFL